MSKHSKVLFLMTLCLGFLLGIRTASASSVSELLGRGLICLPKYPGVYCSWRLLPTDDPNIPFHVYRSTAPTGTFTLLNESSPVTTSTNYHDQSVMASANPYYYKVKPVNGGEESWSNLFQVKSAATATETKDYIDVLISDSLTTIHSVVPADFNADGMFDFVIKTPTWEVCRLLKPPPPTKVSGMVFENGTWVTQWTKDFGWKECSGVQDFHNNPLLAWDLDGDLRAEIILRIGANGETLAVLDGMTGNIRASIPWPEHEPLLLGAKDTDGAVIARLRDMNGDGVADPFIVTHSGLYWGYQRFNSVYFDGAKNELKLIDDFYVTKADYSAREGLGTHGFPIADIDLDGKDELIPCGAAIDDDFSVIWEAHDHNSKRVNTRHNDTCFTADLRPDLPGLETFMGEEDNADGKGYTMLVDVNGHVLWQKQADLSKVYDGWTNGWCANLTDHFGTECFNLEKDEQLEDDAHTTVHIFDVYGNDIIPPVTNNANMLRQSPVDWIGGEGKKERYFFGNPNGRALSGWYQSIYGDLFGDSREEVIGFNKPGAIGFFRISSNIDDSGLGYRRVTPLSDRNYRDALARVGVGYRTNYIPEPAGQERTDVVYSGNPPICTSFNYSVEKCQSNGKQKRNVVTASPSGCANGSPVLSQACTYIPPRPGNEVDLKGTYIDAEDFTDTLPSQNTGTFSIKSDLPIGYDGKAPGFLGAGYLKTQGAPSGNYLVNERKDYSLNFPVTGQYKIWIRGFAPNDSSNSVSFGIDGVKIDAIIMNTYYSSNVWRWTTLKTPFADSGLINVTVPGTHTLNIWAAEANFLVDGIYLADLNQDGKNPTDLVHGKTLDLLGETADVNGDGNVNIKDIQICIKAIVAPQSVPEYLEKCQAVALPDTVVNIKDIQAIIRCILDPNCSNH